MKQGWKEYDPTPAERLNYKFETMFGVQALRESDWLALAGQAGLSSIDDTRRIRRRCDLTMR